MEEITRKRRRNDGAIDVYSNSNFVIGSAEVVERLWSPTKRVLSDYRKRSSPLLVVAILFLNLNSDYWGLSMVLEAMSSLDSSAVAGKLTELEEE